MELDVARCLKGLLCGNLDWWVVEVPHEARAMHLGSHFLSRWFDDNYEIYYIHREEVRGDIEYLRLQNI
jgi:hypothetical protein